MKLYRRLNYVEDLLDNIKQNLGQLKSQSDKTLSTKLLLKDVRVRAPCKDYNLVNKYYRKKLTTNDFYKISEKKKKDG